MSNKLLTSETTGTQLLEIANKLNLYIDYLLPINKIKDVILEKPFNIVNIILNVKGHWVGLFIQKNHAYYFNSFSDRYHDLPKEIIEFMKKNKIGYLTDNIKSIQDPNRGYCGEYVMDFLYYMNKKSSSNIDDYNEFLDNYEWTI